MEKSLIIIGTAHVSQKSVEEVKEVIEKERPDAVALEICPRRYQALLGKRDDVDVRDVLKRGDIFPILLQILLSYFQRKIGKEMKVRPGEEVLVAIQKAREIGADVLLIDRDIAITFKRLWERMSIFEKLKFFYHIFRSFFTKDLDVNEMLKEDTIDLLVKEFRKISPKAAEVLIDERDAYMAFNLKKALEKYKKVVAVVGAGHKKGIMNWLQKEVDVNDLLTVKEGKALKYAFLFLSFLILGIFSITLLLSLELLYKIFLYWFLINGILAALGAALARAHPLSILTAFLCAWFTSLNPLIAAGWLSGLVEAWIRKPSMKDVEELFKSEKVGELMKNKFFRVIMVAAFTNLGSMIGTIYGSYYILTNFGINIANLFERIFSL
ncbi:MAG: TraB/GumN family protein [Archaeoglobaceae archaeon]